MAGLFSKRHDRWEGPAGLGNSALARGGPRDGTLYDEGEINLPGFSHADRISSVTKKRLHDGRFEPIETCVPRDLENVLVSHLARMVADRRIPISEKRAAILGLVGPLYPGQDPSPKWYLSTEDVRRYVSDAALQVGAQSDLVEEWLRTLPPSLVRQ